MRLAGGDAPLARHLAVATALLLPPAVWWLRTSPTALDPCLMRAACGIPCPTCGGTRAALALAGGQPMVSLAANPLVTVGLAATALWALAGVAATLVPRWRRRIETSPGERRRLVMIGCILLVANWAWLIVREG